MKRSALRLLATAVACVALLAACGDDGTATSDGADPTTTTAGGSGDDYPSGGIPDATTTTAADGTVDVALGETSLGDSLVDAQGHTLYVFENDAENASACNTGCVEAWPALTVDGPPALGDGLDTSLFSTNVREDGTTQLAVDGHPLYRFSGDTAAGDENGQGAGNVWHIAGPTGAALGS